MPRYQRSQWKILTMQHYGAFSFPPHSGARGIVAPPVPRTRQAAAAVHSFGGQYYHEIPPGGLGPTDLTRQFTLSSDLQFIEWTSVAWSQAPSSGVTCVQISFQALATVGESIYAFGGILYGEDNEKLVSDVCVFHLPTQTVENLANVLQVARTFNGIHQGMGQALPMLLMLLLHPPTNSFLTCDPWQWATSYCSCLAWPPSLWLM